MDAAVHLEGSPPGDLIKIPVGMKESQPMADGLVGDEEVHRFSLEASTSQPLSPLRSFNPIACRERELVEAAQVLMKAAELFAGMCSLQNLVDNRRGNRCPVLLNQFNDPIADFRNDPWRKVIEPGGGVDQDQVHV